jgi:hypothetical protein
MNRLAGKTATVLLISLCLILLKSHDCAAFRCGNGLVTVGDTKARVLIDCGNPTYKEKAGSKKKGARTESGKSRITDSVTHQKKYREAAQKTEKWYYNCGDNDFIYVLEFENDILRREDTAGRGKGKSDCMGK